MAQPWDYIAKIVSLGDSGCGKSSVSSNCILSQKLALTGNSSQSGSVKAASHPTTM